MERVKHRTEASGSSGGLTTNSRLLVLLEIVVDEPQDKRGLSRMSMRRPRAGALASEGLGVGTYLSDSSFAKQNQLDTAARLGSVSRVGHGGCISRTSRESRRSEC